MTTHPLDEKTKELLIRRLWEMEEKHSQLVWYARSMPPGDPYWDTVPQDIKQGALNSQARIEEEYPDELSELNCPVHGSWNHGFNSGVLAAMRFVLAYLEPVIDPSEDFTLESSIQLAEDIFPDLST